MLHLLLSFIARFMRPPSPLGEQFHTLVGAYKVVYDMVLNTGCRDINIALIVPVVVGGSQLQENIKPRHQAFCVCFGTISPNQHKEDGK